MFGYLPDDDLLSGPRHLACFSSLKSNFQGGLRNKDVKGGRSVRILPIDPISSLHSRKLTAVEQQDRAGSPKWDPNGRDHHDPLSRHHGH
jgi:hypothetical protein